METILTIIAVGTLNVVCFFVGAKVGQRVAQGKEIETPNLNPIDYLHEQREKREARLEKEKYDIIQKNIDNYNGTEFGQIDVPR